MSIRRAARALLFGALNAAAACAAAQEVFVYRGICDASAAVALTPELFVVADDEHNQLKVYKRGVADAVDSIDMSKFLDTKKDKESDLEGAAAIGTRIYWISSHGRNSKGEVQPRRYRFFATEAGKGKTRLAPAGAAYNDLLQDLLRADALKPFASALEAASRLAPEAPGGLNIEGLAARPNGELLIGLRNPQPRGKALLIPLLNPGKVVNGKKAKFGAAIELDLGGRGIRSIEQVGSAYLIVAGPPADSGDFALYRWAGNAADAALRVAQVDFKALRPEALFAVPNSDTVQVLSDDGGVETNGVACKDQDESRRSFRSATVRP